MNISSIQQQDIPSCLDLYNHYIQNTCFTLEEMPLSLEAFRNRVEQVIQRYPWIVAKDEHGNVLGFAYLSVFNERSAYCRTADLSIYVHKDHMHQHVGSKLFKEIESAARLQGITNLISIITNANPISLKFHEKWGFIQEGHLKTVAFKMNQVIDIYYYRKKLE